LYHLKEEALDRTVWRAGFGRGFGSVVRQTAKWTVQHKFKLGILSKFTVNHHFQLHVSARSTAAIFRLYSFKIFCATDNAS
jgi:hypothetical protein